MSSHCCSWGGNHGHLCSCGKVFTSLFHAALESCNKCTNAEIWCAGWLRLQKRGVHQILYLRGLFGSKKEETQKTGGHIRKENFEKIQEYVIGQSLNSKAWEGVGSRSAPFQPRSQPCRETGKITADGLTALWMVMVVALSSSCFAHFLQVPSSINAN